MAKHTGFMEFQRKDPVKRPVAERVKDYREFEEPLPQDELQKQAVRCMNCGIPFCHSSGCPVFNRIPDWNDLVYRNQWQLALELLHSTDNFPEFTGRVCPAPCETACTLGINQPAVSIRQIELQIVERGWREDWIQPAITPFESGKRVAVIGSGPAGLATAQQLARKGHTVIVFEKAEKLGGLLRYGIPDFKLEKWVIDRRLDQMKKEGMIFETGVIAGADMSMRYLQRHFEAIVITAGATVPRNIDIPGRDLRGIHFAMDFLTQQNQRVSREAITSIAEISAKDKNVVVIGGGDTGSDCVGTCHRQGAKTVTQIEILPKPPDHRTCFNPWPEWPVILRTSSSHEEGCERMWSVAIREFIGSGKVKKIKASRVQWSESEQNGKHEFAEIPGSEFELDTDLVLIAAGFLHVEHSPLIESSGIEVDSRGNIVVDRDYKTSKDGIYAAGDAVLGASLVVRAIYHGREVAAGVDRYLAQL
jgi:glutamate synthase (NADPH/NADH) small chain